MQVKGTRETMQLQCICRREYLGKKLGVGKKKKGGILVSKERGAERSGFGI